MKHVTLVILFFAFSTIAVAQVGYYKTYNDYVENNLTAMDAFVEIKHAANAFNIWFMKDGKKVKVLSEDIWGFRNGIELYRLANVASVDVPVRVLYSGDGENNFCLYVPYQTVVKNNNGKPDIDWNMKVMAYGMVFNWCFISKTLNTGVEYCGVGSGGHIDDFRDNYPQFKPYFDCTGKNYKDNPKMVDCYIKTYPHAKGHF